MTLGLAIGRRTVLPENFDPPIPWRSFYIRLIGSRRTEVMMDRLTDEELAWLGRAMDAENERRREG